MEQEKIILNPVVSLKNHSNCTNRFYFIEVEDVQKALSDIVEKWRECIDVIFTFSSLRTSYLYVAAHERLDHIRGDIILADTVTEFQIIFPCKGHEKDSQRILPLFIRSPQHTSSEPLIWDEKMWEIYYWLRVNFRLFNSEIGKKVELDPVTVARRKEKMLPSLHVHYPVYAGGHDNYSTLFFILENIPDLDELLNLLSDLSATSYLVKGSRGTYLCFASTRQTFAFTSKMRKVIQDESLGFAHPSSRWTSILDDYRKGKVEERFFYMFPPRSK